MRVGELERGCTRNQPRTPWSLQLSATHGTPENRSSGWEKIHLEGRNDEPWTVCIIPISTTGLKSLGLMGGNVWYTEGFALGMRQN